MNILTSIPGIHQTAASSLLAEIGTDMRCFPTSEHLSSWAGMSPGNNESAGKHKSTLINHGNPYVNGNGNSSSARGPRRLSSPWGGSYSL